MASRNGRIRNGKACNCVGIPLASLRIRRARKCSAAAYLQLHMGQGAPELSYYKHPYVDRPSQYLSFLFGKGPLAHLPSRSAGADNNTSLGGNEKACENHRLVGWP